VSPMPKATPNLLLILFLLFGLIGAPSARAESDFKVTLLGTASPQPIPDRFGPSTLVEAGDQKLLFDAGRGVPIRLRQINVPLGKITALFLTHYHSDHTSGIPDLWLTGWLPGPFARRTTPFRVIGPVGAKELMANLERAYALDIKIRLEDEKLPPQGIATVVEEFEQDGVVYQQGGVRVIAFTVDHGPAIKPAVGYRIEYKGHSVVISGDTRYNQNVINYGTGADVLIHEVCVARPELLATNIAAQHIMAHHTSPQDAGKVFLQAHPKLAVYTHLVFLADERNPEPTVQDIAAQTRETYTGPLALGEDLMSFEIGDAVTIRRAKP
jgi:ribonuclease Z